MKCSNCGAPVDPELTGCPYCWLPYPAPAQPAAPPRVVVVPSRPQTPAQVVIGCIVRMRALVGPAQKGDRDAEHEVLRLHNVGLGALGAYVASRQAYAGDRYRDGWSCERERELRHLLYAGRPGPGQRLLRRLTRRRETP